MHSLRRVVVTGIGIVSPLGSDMPTTWAALLAGKSGINTIQHCDINTVACQFAGMVKDFTLASFKTKHINKVDLFIQYGLQAAREAIMNANLDHAVINKKRIGVSIGAGLGGFISIEKQHQQFLNACESQSAAWRTLSPFFIPGTIINMLSGLCAIEYGFQGPNFAVSTACATGAHNIGLGARSIAYNDADVMIVGGTEMSSTSLSMAGFSACRALSTRNKEPTRASRPWDKDRDGFVLSDGASVLVLGAYEYAIRRGANIYGEVLGLGMSSDAYDMTAPEPNGEGARMAMENALADAGITPKQVDYINAHATSTRLGDIAEVKAIKSIWGNQSKSLKISATKSMTGHLLGAAGALEAAFCLLAIRDQVAPPTINLDSPDATCMHLNLVPHYSQKTDIKVALSNSFGFGGTNISLIFGKL